MKIMTFKKKISKNRYEYQILIISLQLRFYYFFNQKDWFARSKETSLIDFIIIY